MSETQGDLIDRMDEIREQRRELASEDRALSAEFHELEEALIASMDTIGLTRVGSAHITATIDEKEIASVQDWDKFHTWIRKHQAMHMLERRVSQAAFREYLENSRGHKPPPGVSIYNKRTISLRKRG